MNKQQCQTSSKMKLCLPGRVLSTQIDPPSSHFNVLNLFLGSRLQLVLKKVQQDPN
jgi:hypothetical protein